MSNHLSLLLRIRMIIGLGMKLCLGMVCLLLSCASMSLAQETAKEPAPADKTNSALDAAVFQASQEPLLMLPDPPLGLALVKQPIIIEEKLIGFLIQLSQEGVASKVMIKVELTDRTEPAARLAACKAYVNGLVGALMQAGLTLKTKELPALEEQDMQKPVDFELAFSTAEESEVRIWKRIFFTSKGYDITVIATDAEDLKYLSEWAKQIRPVLAPAARK